MWEITPLQAFILGGPLMWPILLCSIGAMAIVIEKGLVFHSLLREDESALKNKIFTAIRKNDIKGAMIACDLSGTPNAKVLKSGLFLYGRSKQDIEAAMESTCRVEVHSLESRLSALAAIGNIVPLLGFLGTVTGMCLLFHEMSIRSMAINQLAPGDIAGGVWQALITTVAGLLVMIPCILAHNFFLGVLSGYVIRMERTALDLLLFLDQVRDPILDDRE